MSLLGPVETLRGRSRLATASAPTTRAPTYDAAASSSSMGLGPKSTLLKSPMDKDSPRESEGRKKLAHATTSTAFPPPSRLGAGVSGHIGIGCSDLSLSLSDLDADLEIDEDEYLDGDEADYSMSFDADAPHPKQPSPRSPTALPPAQQPREPSPRAKLSPHQLGAWAAETAAGGSASGAQYRAYALSSPTATAQAVDTLDPFVSKNLLAREEDAPASPFAREAPPSIAATVAAAARRGGPSSTSRDGLCGGASSPSAAAAPASKPFSSPTRTRQQQQQPRSPRDISSGGGGGVSSPYGRFASSHALDASASSPSSAVREQLSRARVEVEEQRLAYRNLALEMERTREREMQSSRERAKLEATVLSMQAAADEARASHEEERRRLQLESERVSRLSEQLERERAATAQELAEERRLVDDARQERLATQQDAASEAERARHELRAEAAAVRRERERAHDREREQEEAGAHLHALFEAQRAELEVERQQLVAERKELAEARVALQSDRATLDSDVSALKDLGQRVHAESIALREARDHSEDQLQKSHALATEAEASKVEAQNAWKQAERKVSELETQRKAFELERLRVARERKGIIEQSAALAKSAEDTRELQMHLARHVTTSAPPKRRTGLTATAAASNAAAERERYVRPLARPMGAPPAAPSAWVKGAAEPITHGGGAQPNGGGAQPNAATLARSRAATLARCRAAVAGRVEGRVEKIELKKHEEILERLRAAPARSNGAATLSAAARSADTRSADTRSAHGSGLGTPREENGRPSVASTHASRLSYQFASFRDVGSLGLSDGQASSGPSYHGEGSIGLASASAMSSASSCASLHKMRLSSWGGVSEAQPDAMPSSPEADGVGI